MGESMRRRRGSSGVRTLVASAVAVGIAVIGAACQTSNGAPCNTGDLLSCTCVGGTSGTQACNDGNYGPCSCQSEGGSDSNTGRESGGDASEAGSGLPYMAACSVVGMPGDCAPPYECFNFPNRGSFCTHSCSTPADCLPPSQGCNGMNLCKAPNAGGNGEGGGDGGDNG